jgi:hypothetical protein
MHDDYDLGTYARRVTTRSPEVCVNRDVRKQHPPHHRIRLVSGHRISTGAFWSPAPAAANTDLIEIA